MQNDNNIIDKSSAVSLVLYLHGCDAIADDADCTIDGRQLHCKCLVSDVDGIIAVSSGCYWSTALLGG